MNNVQRVIVAHTKNATAANTADITNVSLISGEIVVLDAANYKVNPVAADTDKIIIAMGTGDGNFVMSSVINKAKLRNVQKTAYAAATSHIMTIGYNGTSGALVVANSTTYQGRLIYNDELRLIASKQASTTFNYTSDATATQLEVATGIATDFNMQPSRYATASVITDGSGNYGVKFDGMSIPTKSINKYEFVRFQMAISETFGTVVPEVIQQGFAGFGLPIQVRELEFTAQANWGQTDLTDYRVDLFPFIADNTKTYDIYTVESFLPVSAFAEKLDDSPVSTVIAFDSTDAALETYLDSYLV